ncbi:MULTISPECIES: hypothetical protein [Gracilibacillus]|uniref:hypothetical protein n=1 Tax=Gracilibacillus TaxID=74385 RepID=UPI000A6BF0BD
MRKNEIIGFTLDDGRKDTVTFIDHENETRITEAFEAEDTNEIAMPKKDGKQL